MGLIDKVNVEVNGSGDLLSTLSTYTTKILKPNIVDGKNILTQAMVSSKNTKYVIKYDYELEEDITVPDNCVLEFDGGSISGAYTVTGTNTSIEAGLVKIFDTDITLDGTWNVAEAYPEWFGAVGKAGSYSGSLGDYDSSTAFKLAIDFCFINHTTLKLSNISYYVTGDNPFGLKYRQEGAYPLDYNRDLYKVNIDGNLANIYWDKINEGDIFSNVGYLRLSEWKNFSIYTLHNNSNHYGTIFQSDRTKNQAGNVFSKNRFSQISVLGGCDKVFEFKYDSGAHDDLSVFELIQACDFNIFVDINNSQSVNNLFLSCAISFDIDNSIGYYIECDTFAGGLSVQNCHFTVSANDCSILKDVSDSVGIVNTANFINNRTEILSQNVDRFLLYVIRGLNINITGSMSRFVGDITKDYSNSFALKLSKNAKVIFENSVEFANFIIDYTSGNAVSSNSSLQLIDNIYYNSVSTAYGCTIPTICYSDGTSFFKLSEVLKNRYYNLPLIRCVSKYCDEFNGSTVEKYAPWTVDYNIGLINNKSEYVKTRLKSVKTNRNNIVTSEYYKVPSDVIAKSIRYYCDDYTDIKTAIMTIGDTAYTATKNANNVIEFVPNRKELLLKKDETFNFKFYNENETQVLEQNVNITNSFIEITYRHPYSVADYEGIEDNSIIEVEFKEEGVEYFDTTLNKPIWWNGTAWVDATGATVQ